MFVAREAGDLLKDKKQIGRKGAQKAQRRILLLRFLRLFVAMLRSFAE